jgi:uncharacterized protein YjbI with pentapeptide repeats/beta-lactamase regulating signal transducer with metallopeptidase domain
MRAADIAFAILCNSLWQAPIIALLTWGVLRIARNASSSTRYAVWMFALAAAIVTPVVTSVITVPAPSRAVTVAPVTRGAAPLHATKPYAVQADSKAASPAMAARFSLQRLRFSVPSAVVLGIIGLWAVVAIVLFARLFIDLLALERLKRDALPLPVEYRDELERWREAAPLLRTVRLCVSSNTEVPVAVGLFDSMILLPSHLLESFSAREIDQIALHELAHLQRADDWSNGVQRIAAALLFFNPAVRWIAHRLDLERELACDDHVVALTRDVRPYAKCLAKMAEVTAWPHHALAAPGVFVTRKSISVRIEQLLKRRSMDRGPVSYGIIGAGAAAVCAFFAVATFLTPVIASPVLQPQLNTRPHDTVAAHKQPSAPKPHASAASVQRIVVYVTPAPAQTIRESQPKPAQHAQPAIVAAATPEPRNHRHYQHPHAHARVGASSCEGCSLAGVDWSNRDLHGMDLRGANLADVNLTNADMRDVDLSGANLSGARLAGANLKGAILRGANLANMPLAGVDLSSADITGANIDAANVDPASLRMLLVRCGGCNFAGANFRNQNLRGIEVSGANLEHADFRGADLSNASFTGVNLDAARFDGARLDGAHFTGCNFSGVDMRTADFSRATLVGSNLSGAILQ